MVYQQQQSDLCKAKKATISDENGCSTHTVAEAIGLREKMNVADMTAVDKELGVLGAVTSLNDDNLRLEVTCGQNQAVLYTSRLQLGIRLRYAACMQCKQLGLHLVFTRESSYCFQRVLAIAILSVCPSVCHTGGSIKNVAR